MDLQKYRETKTFDEKVALLVEAGCRVDYTSTILDVTCHKIVLYYIELPHMSVYRGIGAFGDSPIESLDKAVERIKETLELL